jgi:hypothetical protein
MINQTEIDAIKNKCKLAQNDPWNLSGPTINVPVVIIEKLLHEIEYLKEKLNNCDVTKAEKSTIEKCLNILDDYAHHVTTIPDQIVGQGITKNLALIEAQNLIKKELHY